MTTRIEIYGENFEFCISKITKTQYEKWQQHGFPDNTLREYEQYLELRQNTFESGLIPDNYLTLFVDGKEITDLHSKIAGGKNFSLSSHSYKFEIGKFYLATTQSQSASYALEIEEPFDFKKLRWNVTHFELGKYETKDLLTIEYGDKMLDYDWGGGSSINEYLIQG